MAGTSLEIIELAAEVGALIEVVEIRVGHDLHGAREHTAADLNCATVTRVIARRGPPRSNVGAELVAPGDGVDRR